jgi:non-reducing end alpha-L-arabinofuranosidase
MAKVHHSLSTLVLAAASTLGTPGAAQQTRPQGPCDIYAAAGTPCVTAHSTVRSLASRYGGPLYQVKRADGRLLNIGVVAGGFADAAAHDRFCAGTLCYINRIYDQSGKGNDLMQAPPGPLYPGPDKGAFDTQPIADMAPITIGGGHKAYGVYIMPGMGFRNNNARDLPIDDEPAGIHAVVDGDHYSNGCCFNYGNASTNGLAVGTGTMESVYFGTSTVWGSGSGTGPWIMSDMEAGLFSGYNARVNEANPTITWRFVTGIFGGGGRNFWELKGGNAQEGRLQTFYAGVRPGSQESSAYYPMHKKGAIQMGNGGDNGNGSAGTFYEGVMTAGHPGEGVADKVQANIVAAKYDVARLTQTRLTSFTPGAVKEVTASFVNTKAVAMENVRLTVSLPDGWTARASGPATFSSVAPRASVRATFQVTAPPRATMGFLTLRAAWNGGVDVSQQRVRSVEQVTLNEVRFASGGNATDQFIELYSAGSNSVDISGWRLINTRTWSAPVTLAIIPPGTTIAPRSHYLLGLANSGLVGPAAAGDTIVHLRSTTDLSPGAEIVVGGETRSVKRVGTAATAPTKVFINVSTGPWLDFPAGTTNLPVHSAEGFAVGEKISIDLAGDTELVTVTAVGKAATQTTLASSSTAGATTIKLTTLADVSDGDTLTIGTGQRMERAVVASVGTAGPEGTGVTLTAPLKLPHTAGVDVWGRGTGISFTPPTRFAHRSADAMQALGSGVVLDRPLARAHAYGAPVRYRGVANEAYPNEGYQGPAPQAWFGSMLLITGGAIALTDASGAVVMDALVYGSQQSNSSANGYITRPDLATLEGVQHQGGCIAVVPGAGSGPATANIAAAAAAPGAPNRSIGRFPDGHDDDSLCTDFVVQPATTLPEGAASGATTIKVAGVAGFAPGQTVTIGSAPASETAVIASVGTAGSTRLATATQVEATVIPVAATTGFVVGQSITIDSGANQETATIALVQGGRGGARLTVTVPLKTPHQAGTPLSGSGITLVTPLAGAHPRGAVVTTELPTPGAANRYSNPRAAR